MDTKSISKGVFSFKGTEKKFKLSDYIKDYKNNDFIDCKDRLHVYNQLLLKSNKKIKTLQKQLNDNVFDELEVFIQDAMENYLANMKKKNRLKYNFSLPTALLINGVNTPDHDELFSNICERLKSRLTPHVVRLHSEGCRDVKNIITSLIGQLISDNNFEDDIEDNDDDDNDNDVTINQLKKTKCCPSFRTIVDWYNILHKEKNITGRATNDGADIATVTESTENSNIEVDKKLVVLLEKVNIKDISPNKRNIPSKGSLSNTPSKRSKTNPKSNNDNINNKITRITNKTNKIDDDNSYTTDNAADLALTNNNNVDIVISKANNYDEHITEHYNSNEYDSHITGKNHMSGHDNHVTVSYRSESAYLHENKNELKPIVIIIEDIQSFSSDVIKDFLIICSNYLDTLPLVLIVGTATNINSLHVLLPHSVTSRLSIQQFQTPSASVQLSNTIDQILLTEDMPFKLDYKAFTFLLDFFLFYDFSIHTYVRGYNYAMLQHFLGTPSSIICVDSTISEETILNLSKSKISSLQALPSFQKYFDNLILAEQNKLLNNTDYAKKNIIDFINELEIYHKNLFPILKCLHQFSSKLPENPLGKQLRELYAFVLQADIGASEEYKKALSAMRVLSNAELVVKLECCIEMLSDQKDLLNELVIVKNRMQQFIVDLHDNSTLKEDVFNNESMNTEIKKNITRKLSMKALKELLLENDPNKKCLTKFELLRKEIIDFLDATFRKHLICHRKFVLHEAFYFSNVKVLSDRLNAAPRSTLQRAFNQPCHYLQNTELSQNGDLLSPKLPDICIVYKLHTECGKLINLFDWLQAFSAVLRMDEDTQVQNKKCVIDPNIHARFIRCASELQHLGFIKQTKKKTDHVAKITWTGC